MSPIQTRFQSLEQLQLGKILEADRYSPEIVEEISNLICSGDVETLDTLLSANDVDITQVQLQVGDCGCQTLKVRCSTSFTTGQPVLPSPHGRLEGAAHHGSLLAGKASGH